MSRSEAPNIYNVSADATELRDGATTPDDGFPLPPIQTEPTVITMQPSNASRGGGRRRDAAAADGEDDRSSRIPPSSLDWVSASRSQLSIFSGTYFLSSLEQLEIQQVVDLSSLLGRMTSGAQYRVRVPREETVFLAVEDSKAYQRKYLKSSRELTLNIMDPSGETAYIIRKSMGWGCFPRCLHRITVESTDYLGSVEQNFTIVGLCFTVYDENRRPVCYVEGPSIYTCCMSTETQFQIVSIDKSRQIASLIRHWDQLLVDFSVLLTFSPNTDVKLKGLLLGAAFLLEFLYFENQRR